MERYSVILSTVARKELRDVADYIATRQSAPIAASKKVKRIRDAIDNKLSFMPKKYRLVDNYVLASVGLRRMNVENYIAFFTVDEKNNIVNVVRIIHSKRDWKHVLLGETE